MVEEFTCLGSLVGTDNTAGKDSITQRYLNADGWDGLGMY